MPKRSRKPPADENRAAKYTLDAIAKLSGETDGEEPAAVALGRKGFQARTSRRWSRLKSGGPPRLGDLADRDPRSSKKREGALIGLPHRSKPPSLAKELYLVTMRYRANPKER